VDFGIIIVEHLVSAAKLLIVCVIKVDWVEAEG
jgi:hypothetical protein